VGSRRVYLEAGVAFVPFDNVVSILFSAFRANVGSVSSCHLPRFSVVRLIVALLLQLSKQLSAAFRKYNRSLISKDERLAPVLTNLARHHIDADYSTQVVTSSDQCITPDMIDALSTTSMPLCMRSLHKALKVNHHLKFAGRQQYGLFLKGTGLQLDDAVAFWRQEFCKKMSVDDFNKKYAYNIRHNYGKEGKRKDYTPYNCMRIITGEPPKSGEYHGCPFRHFEQEHLRKALQGVAEGDKQEILALVEQHHYQIACKKHFEATHLGFDGDVMVNHPNAFFDESRKFYAAAKEGVNVTTA
jgi:DNA primase large subunit